MVWDRTFMAFGSIMNAMQAQITPENMQEVTDKAFTLARDYTNGLVENLLAQSEPSYTSKGINIKGSKLDGHEAL